MATPKGGASDFHRLVRAARWHHIDRDGAGQLAAGTFGGSGSRSLDSQAVNAVGRGWVSACLFARTNDQGVTNPFRCVARTVPSPRHPRNRRDVPLEEGAFYGDYFARPTRASLAVAKTRRRARPVILPTAAARSRPCRPDAHGLRFHLRRRLRRFRRGAYLREGPRGPQRFLSELPRTADRRRDKSRKFKQVITTFVHP